ncbi:hypothetical protein AVEN_91340-1 [Araneus ventricosus]|uniref:Uncharacterized protein n=1 Tax=Araneus ventricosus TaxID=182803 RepID=A0A4Y2IX67_ARAVE|nr:hypothetical protein AVEN_91340-1 [Araneus ventricosus]
MPHSTRSSFLSYMHRDGQTCFPFNGFRPIQPLLGIIRFQCAKAKPNHIDIDEAYSTAAFPTLVRKGHYLMTYRKCDCAQVPQYPPVIVRTSFQRGRAVAGGGYRTPTSVLELSKRLSLSFTRMLR